MWVSVAGRKVAFQPWHSMPVRMSRRIGLRTMPSIAAKRACPGAGVEQFVNDHFQTGDFTGYTQTNCFIDNGSCSGSYGSISPFQGSYDASCQAGGYPETSTIQQMLSKPVDLACLTPMGIFRVVYADMGSPCEPSTFVARILYSDGTYTDVILPTVPDNYWHSFNLIPYVAIGKKIQGLLVTITNQAYCNPHIGQFSLKVGAPIVVWDDGVSGEGASAWTTSYDETLSDDASDKPDGSHQSMDITIGSQGAFDVYEGSLSVDASYFGYLSVWWKGNNTGQVMDFYVYTGGATFAIIQFTDNFTGWKHLHFAESNFSVIVGPLNWAKLSGIEVKNDSGSGLTKGLVYKISHVTNDIGV
jgi:hypothetical protein